MPKLDKKTASAAESAEGQSSFEPLLPGRYLAKLDKVEPRDNVNKYGAEQWSAEFKNLHTLDGEKVPGRQWYNLTLPTEDTPPSNYEKSEEKWAQYQNLLNVRVREFFESFGFTTDSDTDEMVGEWAVLDVKRTTIQAGPRQGEPSNEVTKLLSAEDHEELIESFEDDDAYGAGSQF